MNRRISSLVASSFALLLLFGLLVSILMMAGLKATVLRAEASQASALGVRAAVRSLRADYLASADAVARRLLDPSARGETDAKRRADTDTEVHLASAEAFTTRHDLRAHLGRLRRHDAAITNRLEDRLMTLAGTDPARARRAYFTRYLPARTRNMTMVEQGLQMASEEVAAAARLTETEAARTMSLTWLSLALFVVVGTTSGLLLSRAVRTIATQFEKTADEVTQQRDHLQAVMTAMRDALIVVDGSGVVTTVNQATCTLLGWTHDDLVGKPIDRFVQSDSPPPTEPADLERPRTRTVTSRARDGSDIPIAVSAATLRDTGGMPVGAVWVAHDMREQLRMLAEVAAARDAALQGSRIKSEFLANMSHEIRTPMNVILGYTDIILESELTAAQREFLDRVRVSAVGLLDILNDVLDISKVEAGKLSVERVPFSLRGVVGDVTRTLMLPAQEKNLALSVEVAPAVRDRLTGDPTRLRQVMLNLVSNAIKFTDRGEIVVRVAPESSTEAGPSILHVSVSDTGIGIPADKQGVIFQAFTQADGSMSRRYGGTGLGLTIAARLVAMMGGRIWVESTVGEGSVFHFTVPTDLDRSGVAA